MTAAATSHNHRIKLPDDDIPAAQSWRQKDIKAFGSSSSSKSGTQQADYLPLGRDVMEENQVNVLNGFQPSVEKRKRLLTGESTSTCTPWRTKDYTCDPAGLHEEIIDFYEYMKPRPSERQMRREVMQRVAQIIIQMWPQAKVNVFGSFCTELYLPTSDVDLVVFGEWEKTPLFTLEEELKRLDIAVEGSILVLDKTHVPIIKYIDKQTEVKVDISFNQWSGVQCVPLLLQFVQQYPALAKLVLILKQFLTQRQLNEVYYGGISSYSLLLLLVSFLQLHPRTAANESSANLGVLLIEFFELYGRNFNYRKTAIRVKDGGSYFPKEEASQDSENALLYISDPINPEENASASCYGMYQVKQAFDNAYLRLHSNVITRDNPVPRTESLLSTIIQVSEEVNEYRNWVDSTWPVDGPSNPISPAITPSHPYYFPMVPILPPPAHYMPQVPIGSPFPIPAQNDVASTSSPTLTLPNPSNHTIAPPSNAGTSSSRNTNS